MSQIIRILSDGDHLIALTDDGKLFQSSSIGNPCWREMKLPAGCEPVPPRFSLPEEYTPAPCQGSATEPEDSPDFNSLNGPGQGVYRSRFQKPQPRRPTSIGSDGNYIPPLGD